ncbi:MAG TPA: tRNA lysidine(34) synthetase TilS [Thermoleophilaceae bacterium]|nr:tRNA lysidine(34) synthetase TilS [Thermoleophilaceae bacterium]
MSNRPLDSARESDLIRRGEPLLVLLSGGGDSVCLLDVAMRIGARTSALHVNYGLRPTSDGDEEFCRRLCERLGVPLTVEHVELPDSGNLQAAAREARYALAGKATTGDFASAHTASDQAETVLYRLAVSPGSRSLRGMESRRGRLVRPLLEVTREEVREYLRSRYLDWREDPSNADSRFARARVRHEIVTALRQLSPKAEQTIAETARQLREEAEVLEINTGDALEALGGGPAVPLAALHELPSGLRRLVLRRLAEIAAGEPRSLSRREAEEACALSRAGTKTLDMGGGLRAVAEYGTLRFVQAREEPGPPAPVDLPVPGKVRFGSWEVEALSGEPGEAAVSAAAVGERLVVRSWQEGDRLRPVGLGGTKTLQDLFTDQKVPRGLRTQLPVVESGGEIVWVAGVALDERFAAKEGEGPGIGLRARSLA